MKLLKLKKNKTYKYKIKFINGENVKGIIKAPNLEDACRLIMLKRISLVNNNERAFYYNRDEFLTVEIWLDKSSKKREVIKSEQENVKRMGIRKRSRN